MPLYLYVDEVMASVYSTVIQGETQLAHLPSSVDRKVFLIDILLNLVSFLSLFSTNIES